MRRVVFLWTENERERPRAGAWKSGRSAQRTRGATAAAPCANVMMRERPATHSDSRKGVDHDKPASARSLTRYAAQDVVADFEQVHWHVELVVITMLTRGRCSVRTRSATLTASAVALASSTMSSRRPSSADSHVSAFMARSSLASASITKLSGSSRGMPSANSIGALFLSS